MVDLQSSESAAGNLFSKSRLAVWMQAQEQVQTHLHADGVAFGFFVIQEMQPASEDEPQLVVVITRKLPSQGRLALLV